MKNMICNDISIYVILLLCYSIEGNKEILNSLKLYWRRLLNDVLNSNNMKNEEERMKRSNVIYTKEEPVCQAYWRQYINNDYNM